MMSFSVSCCEEFPEEPSLTRLSGPQILDVIQKCPQLNLIHEFIKYLSYGRYCAKGRGPDSYYMFRIYGPFAFRLSVCVCGVVCVCVCVATYFPMESSYINLYKVLQYNVCKKYLFLFGT